MNNRKLAVLGLALILSSPCQAGILSAAIGTAVGVRLASIGTHSAGTSVPVVAGPRSFTCYERDGKCVGERLNSKNDISFAQKASTLGYKSVIKVTYVAVGDRMMAVIDTAP